MFVDAAIADIAVRFGWHAAAFVIGAVVAVISTLLWGKGGRKRLVDSNKRIEADNRRMGERLAVLEAQALVPAITNAVHVHPGVTPEELDRQVREAIRTTKTHGIEYALHTLERVPLEGDGAYYVDLPKGTIILRTDDGSLHLVLPIQIDLEENIRVESTLSTSRNAPDGDGR